MRSCIDKRIRQEGEDYFRPSSPNAKIAAAAKNTLSSAMCETTVKTFDILVASMRERLIEQDALTTASVAVVKRSTAVGPCLGANLSG